MMTPIVETAARRICGTEAGDGVLARRGIPYAAAPVGLLRLRASATGATERR
jgi:carboxylesterase type B